MPGCRVPTEPVRIALLGFGAIGAEIARIAAGSASEAVVVGALVRSPRADAGVPCFTALDALLAARPDVVVECAGQAALKEHGVAVLQAGIDLVPASVGAMAEEAVLEQLLAAARKGGSTIRISSGAIGGIDALAAARHVGLESVRFRSVMPFSASDGASGEKVLYRGSAREAALKYPRHANLAATISLMGLGFERTEVELVADALVKENRHEIHASGAFGSFAILVQGRRIRESSPSSRLVAGSLFSAAIGSAVLALTV
jgi:aspartate dehydrogenase